MQDILELLALIARAGTRRAALARELNEAGSTLELLDRSSEWCPDNRDWATARRQLFALAAFDVQVVPVWALNERFSCVKPLPPALFVRGACSLLDLPAVAIVGARRASQGALSWARLCGRELASRGWVIASGGALGVDGAVHRGGLDAEGLTVVYLGVAIDRSYPTSHKDLFAEFYRVSGESNCLVRCCYGRKRNSLELRITQRRSAMPTRGEPPPVMISFASAISVVVGLRVRISR